MEALQANEEVDECPFGAYEEEAIVSLIIDHPEFFSSVVRFLHYQLFSRHEVQYVIAHILTYRESYGVFPTRGMLLDIIKRDLTVDSVGYEDILAIVSRPSDPREIPALKERILEFLAVRQVKGNTKSPILCFIGHSDIYIYI